MWDYLRQSGGRGFFLPLSGGADSSAVATLVSSMSHLVFESLDKIKVKASKMTELEKYNAKQLISDLCRILGAKDEQALFSAIKRPQDITNRIFVTCYMGT